LINLILATGNAHKAEEFAVLFPAEIISIKAAPEKLEVAETGTTYFENALIKAQCYYDKFKIPVLSDDSGLTVESLPDDLGVYSARFGGEGLNDKARAHLLLEKLAKYENRNAFFTCVLCFYLNPREIFYFEGRVKGKIDRKYTGEGGFGYDPVFIPDDHDGVKTLAEIPEWKNKNSHRAVASQLALKFFSARA
jgi:XTP/dITP diphosphohydrolase